MDTRGRDSEHDDKPADKKENQITEVVKRRLKANLREKFTSIYEGLSSSQSRLENVYMGLYITQQTEAHGCVPRWILNIFKPERNICQQQPEKDRSIQTVMTKGIAGIGKTVAVQNFSLSWAEGKSNQHIDFIFMLPFRELNMLRDRELSLLQLLCLFYPEVNLLEETQQLVTKQLLFIFDGLDESRFLLDFDGAMIVSEITQRAAVDVLLTNLIKRNLLPNALLWLTSRPAAASQIPVKYIDRMTEVQGFTDQQREEYFEKKFCRATQAKEALSYFRGMISFYFMGHIPILCWITAEVLRKGWSELRSRRITTMTELYIYHLLLQTQRAPQKSREKGSKVKALKETSESTNAAMISNLSKLAFEQLQKGNIIFYEEDLRECGIDVEKASQFCGFFSEILKQEHGLYRNKMFSFVHLSFQEFLAALHVFLSCLTKNTDTLKSFLDVDPIDLSLLDLQKKVVDKVLQSDNSQLDLFLCFFLGISLESNQKMLQDLLPQIQSSSDTAKELKRYLKNFTVGDISPERCMNLLVCKLELKEERIQDDIREYLQSGVRLSPVDCSLLSTMLNISGELLDELDLTKCITPKVGIEKLLSLMKKCRRAV